MGCLKDLLIAFKSLPVAANGLLASLKEFPIIFEELQALPVYVLYGAGLSLIVRNIHIQPLHGRC